MTPRANSKEAESLVKVASPIEVSKSTRIFTAPPSTARSSPPTASDTAPSNESESSVPALTLEARFFLRAAHLAAACSEVVQIAVCV